MLAPFLLRAALAIQVVQGLFLAHQHLDYGRDAIDRLLGLFPANQLLGDAVLLDEPLGLLLGDAQLDQLTQVFRLRLVVGELGVHRFELDQRLSRPDVVTHVVQDLGDPSGPLGADGDLLPPAQGADDIDGPLDGSPLEGAPR